MSGKEDVINLMNELPESATTEDIMCIWHLFYVGFGSIFISVVK